MSETTTDFWCWDRQGVLLLVIAIPVVLLQIIFLFAFGTDSHDWFTSPLTSGSLMYMLLAFWYFGMYPIRCIKRTLLPHIIKELAPDQQTISKYLEFISHRRMILLIWGLFALVVCQVVWSILVSYAWGLGLLLGNLVFAWMLFSMLLLVYISIIGIGGRLLNTYLKGKAVQLLEPILNSEKEWMDKLRAQQSM